MSFATEQGDDFKIPSRKEHNEDIRRLWKLCIGMACAIFVVTGGVTGFMFWRGMDPKTIVAISTALFQVLILSYGMGFFVPAFMTSLKKMGLAVEMSRKGLEVGQETANTLNEVKAEVQPLIKDTRAVMEDVKPVVHQVSGVVDESKKLIDDAIREIREGNGHLQGKSGDTVKTAISEARKALKGAEGEFEQLIWRKVDTFLEGVFNSDSSEEQKPQDN